MNARAAVFVAALLAAIVPTGGLVFAHHSFAMFEMEKDVTYKGVVTEYKWMNPHVHITVDIKPGPGIDPATVGTWDVEGGSTNIMGRQGWTRATFKLGDTMTLVGHPMKDGSGDRWSGVTSLARGVPALRRFLATVARDAGL